MDALSLMMALFLNLSEACTALPADEQRVGLERFQILNYACGDKRFRIWSRRCLDGRPYWSRPFLLEETGSGQGFYMNQFAEVQSGYHVELRETYVPKCGA
ncbi:MAG: hypothetical protein H8K10_15540 [Nitrospira sp.]|nr:hypothetical protein [Nitrospira sp.]